MCKKGRGSSLLMGTRGSGERFEMGVDDEGWGWTGGNERATTTN
jgi:hypothetical protein